MATLRARDESVWCVIGVAFVALASGGSVGCSGPAGGGTSGPAPSAQQPVAVDDQVARIQRYIDSIYTQNDVRDSFLTNFHEPIDCVDFEAIPSVKALRASGVELPPMTGLPLPERVPMPAAATTDLEESMINTGRPDENGHPRICPSGTVPYVRLTVDRILKAGGIEAFLAAVHGKALPPARPLPPMASDSKDFAHAYADYTAMNQGGPLANQGGAVWMSVFAPSIGNGWLNGGQQHSLAQLWIVDATSQQTAEVGWTVDYAVFSDLNAHLFINATIDGYKTTGCYDNLTDEPSNLTNGPAKCVAWMPNGAGGSYAPPFALGQMVCEGSCPGMEIEFAAMNFNGADNIPAAWYVYALSHSSGTNPFGAYLSTSGTNHYTGQMQTTAGLVEMGGEVSDPTNTFTGMQMGSGDCGEGGYGEAAYYYNAGYWDESFNYQGISSGNDGNNVIVPPGLFECPQRFDLYVGPVGSSYWNKSYPWGYFGGTASTGNPSTGTCPCH